MTQYDFSGKVALITGGASGIGEACVKQFVANGATVVIADLNDKLGQTLAAQLNDSGATALFVKTDVTDAANVQALIDKTVAQFGRLDFAINSAGISGEANILTELSLEGWHRVIDINLNSVFYCMRSQIPAMLQSGGGSIVNLASIMGLVSSPTVPAYVAAKHGVAGLTKSGAQAYSAQGVRINAICPGYIETPMVMGSTTAETRAQGAAMHPIGRLGRADEIAAMALFLCSDGASFISGGIYPVDGGYLTN